MKQLFIILLSVILFVQNANAQLFRKKKPAPTATAVPKATLAEKIKKLKKMEGLFTMYQDTSTGSLFLLIKAAQLNKEYIYFSYVENGTNATGHNKGTFRDNKVFKLSKIFNQIEFTTVNTSFYFDPANEISKAANANISNGLMASEKIVVSNENNTEFLIEADNIFLSEVLYQIKQPSSPMSMQFGLGILSKSKTKYYKIKNYPENSDIVVRYVYDDQNSRGSGSSSITDARYVEIYLQHSFIEMPNNSFKPRKDDPRIGYFMTQTNDMTTKEAINYKDMIHRWHLEKKDPSAALSEPVKPITWWIENTTPKEFRPVIMAAILNWNIAFEKAGFKNAVQIFEQPDSCDWDAGDIRYNVLRWTSSPEPPFGGYGPSFVNPKTGEILGADIMLEWIFITNKLKSKSVFEKAGFEWLLETEHNEDGHSCMAGDLLNVQNNLGKSFLQLTNQSTETNDEFIKQSLYYLVLHEVGHTLGLNHNMRASHLHSVDDLYDIKKTTDIGLIGSVMDYPAANFSNRADKKCQYFTTKPGPYDLWAIEFGYYQENDEAKSLKRRNDILNRSTEPSLCFGNDADDMRSPGKAIDPRVMIGDMSSDAIGFATERVDLIKSLLIKLDKKEINQEESYESLRNSFLTLTSEWSIQAGVVSRYIGGIYVDRSFPNQKSANKPYEAVPIETQKKAMAFLTANVFDPEAFNFPVTLIPYLQQQRRGFGFFAKSEEPKLNDRVMNIQVAVLSHILHPNTTKRITESKNYGNTYLLNDVLKDMTNAIFLKDMNGSVNTYRQNLQILYINALMNMTKLPMYDYISASRAEFQLRNIQKMMQGAAASSTGETKEHRLFVSNKIKNELEKGN